MIKLTQILKRVFFSNAVLFALAIACALPFIKMSTVEHNKLNFLKQKIDEPLRLYAEGKIKTPTRAFSLRALKYFQVLSKLYPKDALFAANVGFCYFHLGETEKAIRFYRQAIKMEPQLYVFSLDLGMIEFSLKNYPEAAELLRQSLNLLQLNAAYFSKMAKSEPAGSAKSILFLALLNQVPVDAAKAIQTLALCRQHLSPAGETPPAKDEKNIRLHVNNELIHLKYFLRQ